MAIEYSATIEALKMLRDDALKAVHSTFDMLEVMRKSGASPEVIDLAKTLLTQRLDIYHHFDALYVKHVSMMGELAATKISLAYGFKREKA